MRSRFDARHMVWRQPRFGEVGTLVELARRFNSKHLLQVLYHAPTEWARIDIDGEPVNISDEVIRHFRNADSVCNLTDKVVIEVLKDEFRNSPSGRTDYCRTIISSIRARGAGPGIVFLDPDTGIEPQSGRFGPTHVREAEIRMIWEALRAGDLLVIYQHEDNKAGREWRHRKMSQFANAVSKLSVRFEQVKQAYAPGVARDVALFFVAKS
jgi:hypothetical protein